jgi:hypothetical protein
MMINCRPSLSSNTDLFMSIPEEIYMGLMLIRITKELQAEQATSERSENVHHWLQP